MPLLSTLNAMNPAMRTLAATVGTAFAVQTAFAAVAVPLKTEKYYDLSGSLTFLSCTAMSLYYPALHSRFILGKSTPFPSLGSFHTRQLFMSGAVTVWAARLGTFLFQRISNEGKDGRFDEIKQSPPKFFGAWMAQATWVSLTALPVYIVNSIPKASQPALGLVDIAGFALWTGAFLFEVVADRQKSAWRDAKKNKEHEEKFITSGLWSKSRHPNYAGEVSLWAAQSFLAINTLSQAGSYPGWVTALMVVPPLFEYLLITRVSGVPMLEKAGDEKFGKDPSYQKYKKETPVFWPKIF